MRTLSNSKCKSIYHELKGGYLPLFYRKQALLILAFTFLTTMPSFGIIRYVKPVASGNGSGTSWANASSNLQAMINASLNGDVIWVAAGTYKPTTTTDRNAAFSMKNGVGIYGGFLGMETLFLKRDWNANITILSGDIGTIGFNGDNSYNVIRNINSGLNNSAILNGFTIRDGYNFGGSYPGGGGILNIGNCSPTIANCKFINNFTNGGGGGMSNVNYSSPIIVNCEFKNNTANNGGGGIYNLTSSPSISNSIISGNSSNHAGGGIFNINYSSPTLRNTIFIGNSAYYGGGILNDNSSPNIHSCSFSGNNAPYGGGIYNHYSNPVLRNCIIWGNSNSIFNSGASPSVSYSIIQQPYGIYPGTGNKNASPLFVSQPPIALGTMGDLRLKIGSPAIDAGTATNAPTTDLDGKSRPLGLGYDMGAYEYENPCQNTDMTDTDHDGLIDACDDDDDNDGVLDVSDNCPLIANTGQLNTDGDSMGNACDPDDDNDGVLDINDNCPLIANTDQLNTDGDSMGDVCDPDDDNDGVLDVSDNCPLIANTNQLNTDGDSMGNACDPDDDNDGVLDGSDNCPLVANADQLNTDGDSMGDVCDPDDDNDGVLDGNDNCPLIANSDQQDSDTDGPGDACDLEFNIDIFNTNTISYINDINITAGQKTTLTSKLDDALTRYCLGFASQALNKLNSFKVQVQAYKNAGILSAAEADYLTNAANALIAAINAGTVKCPDPIGGPGNGSSQAFKLDNTSNVHAPSMTIFPNPTSGKVNIHFAETTSPMKVVVSNIYGLVIMEVENSNHQQPMVLDFSGSQFSAGIFYISASNENGTQTQRLIITK